MSAIDNITRANQRFALDYDPAAVSPRPKLRVAVVTCMDTRLSRRALGLEAGDAHLIRNAGGIVTEDVVRSLLISHSLLGTNEFMVVSHTDCGLQKASEAELQQRFGSKAGGMHFHAFTDPEQNVREQLAKLRSLKWIEENGVLSRGFVFDVQTGMLREVIP